MRLRLEVHHGAVRRGPGAAAAQVAREVIGAAELDTVQVGPFGNAVEGAAGRVLDVVAEALPCVRPRSARG